MNDYDVLKRKLTYDINIFSRHILFNHKFSFFFIK